MSLLDCYTCGSSHPSNDMIEINGDHVCSDCEDEIKECNDCSFKTLEESDLQETTDWDLVCSDCASDYNTCEKCDNLTKDNNYTVDDGIICNNCRSDYYSLCQDCNKYVKDNDSYTIYNGSTRCESCMEDYYSCDSCGDYYYYDDIHHYNHVTYCSDCKPDNANIHDYNYEPDELEFLNIGEKDKIYFGFELEVISRSNMDYTAERLQDQLMVYCKEDGSLGECGFEIVSHPMTLGYIKKEKVFETIGGFNNSLKSFHDTRTGFHVHMTRSDFSSLHLYKFMAFHEFFQDFIIFIAQRKPNDYWDFYNCTNNIESLPKVAKKGYSNEKSRYMVINLKNSNTIEMRYFKGNLKADRNLKNIEFLHALYYYTKQSQICVNLHDFLTFCFDNRKQYPNLINYYKENEDLLKTVFNFTIPIFRVKQLSLLPVNLKQPYTSDNKHNDSLVIAINEV